MAKVSRGASKQTKSRQTTTTKARPRTAPAKTAATSRSAEQARTGWATDLVFDVREPKLAVSLRLDADVLRFFRGFGAGYQTRINEVLKAFMQARGGATPVSHAVVSARASHALGNNGHGKRAGR
ncbi:MAG TPA: BrnA antitoxin family protein [Rhodopila sp.]|jgi:uncharacterized protein (DUF4415 family)|nr:BrnA antitoxin family protein [Rhodopila sp.]